MQVFAMECPPYRLRPEAVAESSTATCQHRQLKNRHRIVNEMKESIDGLLNLGRNRALNYSQILVSDGFPMRPC